MVKNLKLGEVLVEEGYITSDQLKTALDIQKQNKGNKLLGEVLTELGIVSEEQILKGLSKKLGCDIINIEKTDVDIKAVKKVPKNLALKYKLIAIKEDADCVTIVIQNPLNFYAIEDIKLILNKNIEIKIAKSSEIEKAIIYWYSEIEAQTAAKNANISVQRVADFKVEDLEKSDVENPVVSLVNSTLFKAYATGASDVHIEPFEDKTLVRIRVDGQMVDFLTLEQGLNPQIVSRIKILSGLDIAEKRLPQDGHFRAKMQNIELNVRTSIMPTVYGEKAVLRFLNKDTRVDNAETLGMSQEAYRQFAPVLDSPYGMIYFTGPTGSGKTTTLYMVIEKLMGKNVNIATIEDPVERNIPKVNQTQTNNVAGLTFERGLRAILRQDPDVIMIGETRDRETADIAVRSAITGHLVLSTLHTNDSISAIVRLMDIGIENYMISSSLAAVVAQRLVRKVCANCKKVHMITDEEEEALGFSGISYVGAGCPECNYTGYKGRRSIHEVFIVDKEVRKMINMSSPIDDIYRYAIEKQKLRTLKSSLLDLVKEGVTSAEEYRRLTYLST